MRYRSLAALAALSLLAAAVPADAARRQRVLVERFSGPYEFAVDCSEFGPYDFENVVTGTQRVRVVDVLGADGTLLQTVFHIGFRETDANSESGASLPLRGAVHEVWDHAAGARTIDGVVFIGTSPGRGVVIQDTGRITMELGSRIATFMAGPHEAFLAGGVDPLVCEALTD